MSKQMGFNGSAWVPARFWRGDAWVEWNPDVYVPPVMGVVGNYTFDDGTVQGWSGSGYDNAGEPYNSANKCRQDITQAGLLSASYMASDFTNYRVNMQGQGYRLHCSMQIIRRSGSLPNTVKYRASCADSSTGWVTRPEGNSGWFEVVTGHVAMPYATMAFPITIEVDAGDLNGNSLYSVEVDWARVEGPDGNPLQYFVQEASTTPGYQPKVFNGWEWV